MDLSSLLQELDLSVSDKPRPSPSPPPITDLLCRLREKLIGPSESEAERSDLIRRVERLFQTADPDWLFPSTNKSDDDDDGDVIKGEELKAAYTSLVCALIGCSALPLCEDDCSPVSASAYQNLPTRATAVGSALTALLRTLGHVGNEGTSLLLAVAPSICVFAVTHFQERPWSSPCSRASSQCLHVELLRAGGWTDDAHFLFGAGPEDRCMMGDILDLLQPQLDKGKLFRCEEVKLVFAWTLLQARGPSLSPLLSRVLPPSLLLNDHFRPENCILGIRCLHRIVLNVPAADLRQFNRAEVIYQALFKHLYTSEAAVIELSLSCLLDVLWVLEKPLPSSPSTRKCRHDDVMRLFLTHMEPENKMALRRVYASALPQYVDRMGVSVCRHLKRLERVVLSYLEISDPPEQTSRLKVLEALQKTIKTAWPRIPCRSNVLLCSLLKLLVDVTSDSLLIGSVRDQLTNHAAECIKLLDACCHGKIQPLLQQVDSSCCSAEVLRILATVTATTER